MKPEINVSKVIIENSNDRPEILGHLTGGNNKARLIRNIGEPHQEMMGLIDGHLVHRSPSLRLTFRYFKNI